MCFDHLLKILFPNPKNASIFKILSHPYEIKYQLGLILHVNHLPADDSHEVSSLNLKRYIT